MDPNEDLSGWTDDEMAEELERLAQLEDDHSAVSAGHVYREAARRLRERRQ
jgi:hypothetical protein